MKQTDYAVLLPTAIPQELLSLLKSYLHLDNGLNVLFCSEFEQQGHFVRMVMLKNNDHKKTGVVFLPTQYVLAVADLSDKESFPLGFLSSP